MGRDQRPQNGEIRRHARSVLEFQTRRGAAGAQGSAGQSRIIPSPCPAAESRHGDRPAGAVDDTVSPIPDGRRSRRKDKGLDAPAFAIEEKTIAPAIEDNAAGGQPRQCAAGKEASQALGRCRFKSMNPPTRRCRQQQEAAPGARIGEERADRRRFPAQKRRLPPGRFR